MPIKKFKICYGSKVNHSHAAGIVKLASQHSTTEHFASENNILSWLDECPDSHVVILDGDDAIIGHGMLVPVSDEFYDAFMDGTLSKKDLMNGGIRPYREKGAYKVFLSNIILSKDHIDTGAFLVLKAGIMELLSGLKARGYLVPEFCSLVFSSDGEKEAKAIGMKKGGAGKDGLPIYFYRF